MLSGKKFNVITLGCRSNQYEAEALISQLLAAGAELSELKPDIILLVTCSITARADSKVKKILRAERKRNPQAYIVVTGCYAQGVSSEVAREMGANLLVGNRLKGKIPELVAEHLLDSQSYFEYKIDIQNNDEWDSLKLKGLHSRTRAFIKIQDGCNHGCSYCIVPSVRGKPISRNPDDILAEIQAITDGGCQEVILTGIHIGLYNYQGIALPDLLTRIAANKQLKRIRFGSIEPFALNVPLLETLAETSIFCRHIHVPIQSGDDNTLLAMKRGYNAAQIRELVGRIRHYLGSDVHISSDLIVAFPGESSDAFNNSLRLLEELRFGKIHVFPYSKREGTAAALLKNNISSTEVKERVARAMALSDHLLEEYGRCWVGKKVEVLIEKNGNSYLEGWIREYVRANILTTTAFSKGEQQLFLVKRIEQGTLFGDIM